MPRTPSRIILESIVIARFSIIIFSFYGNFKYNKQVRIDARDSLSINLSPTAMLIWIFELIWKKPDVNIRPRYTPDINKYTPPPPAKESKRSPNYSLDPPHPFVKKNYALSSLDKTRSWIYQTIAVHPTSNLSFSRRGHVSSCCKINSSHNALSWNRQDEKVYKT